MADVFISYKSQRRKAVEHLAGIFRMNGYTVWYDSGLNTGEDFSAQIETELRAAKAVVTLWCSLSVGSEWVKEEAHLARQLGTAIPVLIEPGALPFGFGLSDTVDLTKWDGSPRSPMIDRVLMQVGQKVGRDPVPNLRELIAFEEPWRRYGAPSLAQFALDHNAVADETHDASRLKKLADKLGGRRDGQSAAISSFMATPPARPSRAMPLVLAAGLAAAGIGAFALLKNKAPDAAVDALAREPVATAPAALNAPETHPTQPAATIPALARKLNVMVVADDGPADSVSRANPIVRKIDRELVQLIEVNGLQPSIDPRPAPDAARPVRLALSVGDVVRQQGDTPGTDKSPVADVVLSFRTYIELQRIPVAPNLTRPAIRVVARLYWAKTGQSFATIEPRSGSIAPVLATCDAACLLDALSTDLRVMTTDIARFAAERVATDAGRNAALN